MTLELLGRMLWDQWPGALTLLACVTAGALLLSLWQRPLSPAARGPLVATAMLMALVHGATLAWLCDDAFISFRYADNLVAGHGLVWNPGERVEGYTNFLWTVLLAAAIAVGMSPAVTSLALGLASVGALVWVTERIVRAIDGVAAARAVPLAAIGVAASYSVACFATSGLETGFAACLAAAALERALRGRHLAAGVFGILATLAHPDHGLLYAGLGAALLLGGTPLRQLVRYALPFLLGYVPYFALRAAYYGELLPNTFHAKSGDAVYTSQGLIYLCTWLVGGAIWVLLPPVAAGLSRAPSRLLRYYAVLGLLPYLAYVTSIGGDFMFGRLLVALVPALMASFESGVARAADSRGRVVSYACVALLPLTALPPTLLGPEHVAFHVADERHFYPVTSLSPLRVGSPYHEDALAMRTHLRGLPRDPLLAIDCVGMAGYHSGLPIVDRLGLTDRHVARQAVTTRGRPGHEKVAHPAYLLERGVDLSNAPVHDPQLAPWSRARFGDLQLYTVHYDPALMDDLSIRPDVHVPSPALHLRTLHTHRADRSDPALRACAAWALDEAYVAEHGSAEERLQLARVMLTASARASDPAAPASAVGFDRERTHREVGHIDFELRPGSLAFRAEGSAFAQLPTRGPVRAQMTTRHQRGAFLNSFTADDGDRATGELRSAPFTIEGDVISLHVGGGRDLERLAVRLVVDDEAVARATGCNSEVLGTRLWDVADHLGKRATLEVVDRRTDGWGHVMVDELVQWEALRPPPVDSQRSH